MKLKKVHRVLQFDQECWMEPYNRMNTEFQKQAKNNFEKNFYNLMYNSVFGKTMENVQKQVHNTIVCGDESEKICKLIVSPLFAGCTLFFSSVSECTKSVWNWTSLFMLGWWFSISAKYWCTIFNAMSLRASTGLSVSSSILTQTASGWR